ncbi:MAG TPA: hypothetical protein VEY30_07470 [Myxococcaceae bacterium]|nr:hypothetical protein [Myxococcaceae bacterium]
MRFLLLSLGISACSACVSAPKPLEAEPLYFALEVRSQGRLVARPKLLGANGVRLQAERRQPGATEPDFQLTLDPEGSGETFRVSLDLAIPSGRGRSRLALLHGQERKIQLGARPGDLEVSLMLMRVDSPEFRALMAYNTSVPGTDAGAI